MIVTLATERLESLEQVRAFVEGSEGLDFAGADSRSRNDFARRMLAKFDYGRLGRGDKGLLRRFLRKATGLSRAQVTRLIGQHARTGRIVDRRRGGRPAKPFVRRYTAADAVLLAEVDATLGQVCGQATRAVMRREFELFGDARFERLAGISTSHLYNLRKSRTYERQRVVRKPTRPTAAAIGERRKPRPEGRPGFVRVDSVHQGDLDGRKGVYEINLVDEVTQYEFVGAVEAISERFLIPVLEGLLGLFPFVIKGFHADNGSEYVNRRVAGLLEKLRAEFTRSRPRRSNDNALVESKNASVVRRNLGREHIPAAFAPLVHEFASAVLSPHLNYHRPCLFAAETVGQDGRVRKVYRDRDVATPYERLKAVDGAERFLKPGVSFAALDAEASAESDLESTRRVARERDRLFSAIRDPAQAAA